MPELEYKTYLFQRERYEQEINSNRRLKREGLDSTNLEIGTAQLAC